MTWEARKSSGNRYYTLTYWVGKKRRRVYIGRGPMAELAEAFDIHAQIQRELARRRIEALRGKPVAQMDAAAAEGAGDRTAAASRSSGSSARTN